MEVVNPFNRTFGKIPMTLCARCECAYLDDSSVNIDQNLMLELEKISEKNKCSIKFSVRGLILLALAKLGYESENFGKIIDAIKDLD